MLPPAISHGRRPLFGTAASLLCCALFVDAYDVGTNMWFFPDGDFPYADLVRSCQRPCWGQVDKPYVRPGPNVTESADGWPLTDFGFSVYSRANDTMSGVLQLSFVPRGPAAKVVLKPWDCSCTVGTLSTIGDTVYTNITCPPQGPGKNSLSLSFYNTGGGATNISLMQPGHNFGQKDDFAPRFLAMMKPYRRLRFMDWFQTNDNNVSQWSQRTQRNSVSVFESKGHTGLAYEEAIRLVNTLQSDIWLNVPAMADDEYFENLATLVFEQLDPKLTVWLELSNENWCVYSCAAPVLRNGLSRTT